MSEEIQECELSNKDTISDTSQNKSRAPVLNTKSDGAISTKKENETNSPKISVETFTERSRTKLRDMFFSGTYEDRVYVESLQGYRDRVIVDEEETRFIKSLKSVLKRGKKLQNEQFQGIKSKFDQYMICYTMKFYVSISRYKLKFILISY